MHFTQTWDFTGYGGNGQDNAAISASTVTRQRFLLRRRPQPRRIAPGASNPAAATPGIADPGGRKETVPVTVCPGWTGMSAGKPAKQNGVLIAGSTGPALVQPMTTPPASGIPVMVNWLWPLPVLGMVALVAAMANVPAASATEPKSLITNKTREARSPENKLVFMSVSFRPNEGSGCGHTRAIKRRGSGTARRHTPRGTSYRRLEGPWVSPADYSISRYATRRSRSSGGRAF